MKKHFNSKGKVVKASLATGLSIMMFSGLFSAVNNYVLASNMDKPLSIATEYGKKQVQKNTKASDYVKANYSVLTNKAMPCTNANALSKKQAAELGAKYLWDMFQLDLEGKTIYMSFSVNPSSGIGYWYGDIYDKGDKVTASFPKLPDAPKYGFAIEAITGNRSSAYKNYEEEVTDTISYKESDTNKYYKSNCKEFLSLAKKVAKKQLPADPVKAEFVNTSAVLALGYEFEIPEGKTSTFEVVLPNTDVPDTIKVSPDGEFPASHVFIHILVTDSEGNQVEVSFDTQDKSLNSISSIYKGIDYDPNSVG